MPVTYQAVRRERTWERSICSPLPVILLYTHFFALPSFETWNFNIKPSLVTSPMSIHWILEASVRAAHSWLCWELCQNLLPWHSCLPLLWAGNPTSRIVWEQTGSASFEKENSMNRIPQELYSIFVFLGTGRSHRVPIRGIVLIHCIALRK